MAHVVLVPALALILLATVTGFLAGQPALTASTSPDQQQTPGRMPMTATTPMAANMQQMMDMMNQMAQMMQQMQAMMGQGMGMMDTNMPMTSTMPMRQPGMGSMMGMMGRMMQMTGMMHEMMQPCLDRMAGAPMRGAMPITGMMPMTGTPSMGHSGEPRMMQMMGQMMQMMGMMQEMMDTGRPMMQGASPMTGTMSMTGAMRTGQSMMPMMGIMQQMMNQMQQLMGGAPVTTTMPASGTAASELAVDLPQTAQVGAVTVKVTPLNLNDAQAETLDFQVVLDTHSVELDVDLAKSATLHVGETELTPAAWESDSPKGHHVEGVLHYLPPDVAGVDAVTLTIAGLPEQETATFNWTLKR
jgi:hypothetical protein